jgi:ferritin-like protein
MASDTYHEPLNLISEKTKDLHRAITSLMEELEAIDWYQQRAEATQDPTLRAVLEHNRNEETEHAMMVLEWIRRNNPIFDVNVHTYLMQEGPITEIEKIKKDGSNGPTSGSTSSSGSSSSGESLGVGSLRVDSSPSAASAREEG